jgi:hypothetical protein
VSPYLSGLIYEGSANKETAMRLIGEAIDERLLRPGWLAVDPMFNFN